MFLPLFTTGVLATILACNAEIVESFLDLHSTEFDFVIIGGGTAGNVVANRLTENSNTSVLVLEAGGSPTGIINVTVPFFCLRAAPQTINDWNYTTTPQPGLNNRSLPFARGHVLGGSSSVNFLAYTRGTFEDWDRYARTSGDPGWSWNAMQKYFRKNERWTAPADHHNTIGQFNPAVHSFNGINSVSLAGFPLSLDQRVIQAAHQSQGGEFAFNLDYNSGRHLGVGFTQSTINNGERSSSATSYLGPQFINRNNLHVVLHAQVARVLAANQTSQGQLSFDTVEFTDGVGGPVLRVQAKKEIILSGGSIGSPHILLNSGVGNSESLQNIGITPVLHLPSVGQNLSDHPIIMNQWSVNANDSETLDLMNRNATVANENLELWQEKRAGPLVDGIFNTVGYVHLPENADIFQEFPGQDPSPGPNTAHIELLPMNGILRPPFPPTGHFLTVASALLQPTARGSVTLRSNNPFEPPLINPNFLGNNFDVALLREGVKLARKLVTLPAFNGYIIQPLTNATTDDEIDQFTRNGVIGFAHPVSTCAMSPRGAEYGVVDPDLRLKGAKGLRVVDASILPFTPAGHTQASVYVVAERASDLIKSQWGI